tara:strand:- start:265 stop:1029 length:765 start_codon:yes stop_codon:yes gene_type:complete
MESYVDTTRVSIRPIYKPLARDMIEKNHYSGRLSSCRYPLGVFYKTDNAHQFFDETEEKLIGVACYGFPVGRRVVGSIFNEEILENKNVLELTRLYIHDGYGKNIESHVISASFKWMKEFAPNIKVLVSYADPEQSHDGAIYQATNWIYQGCGDFQLAPTYSLRLTEDGVWMHSRSVYSKFGSANPKKMVKSIGHTFWLKKEASKHRYIYFLGNKKENRKFHSVMKHPEMKYPKDYKHEIEIRKIEVDDNKWKD